MAFGVVEKSTQQKFVNFFGIHIGRVPKQGDIAWEADKG